MSIGHRTTETVPLAEANTQLSELVARVNPEHVRVTVTVDGRPAAVLIAPDDLESLEETIAVLSDANAMRQLADSDAELARGEAVTLEELREAMRHRRRSA